MQRQRMVCCIVTVMRLRVDLIRSVNNILNGLAKRFWNSLTLIGPSRDDLLNESFHRKRSPS